MSDKHICLLHDRFNCEEDGCIRVHALAAARLAVCEAAKAWKDARKVPMIYFAEADALDRAVRALRDLEKT